MTQAKQSGRMLRLFFTGPISGVNQQEFVWHRQVLELVTQVAVLEGFEVVSYRDVTERSTNWALEIMESIRSADIIVADVSSRNPNVMYEFGMAAAASVPTLLLAGSSQAIPFDVSSRSVVVLEDQVRDNRELIASALRAMVRADGPTTGVLTGPYGSAGGVVNHRESPPISITVYNGPVFQGPVTVSDQGSFVGQDNSQVNVNLAKGDAPGLIAALAAAGLPAEVVEDLQAALQADEAEGHSGDEPGPNVAGWWSRLTLGGRSAAGKVAIGASGGLIAKLIGAYFGMH